MDPYQRLHVLALEEDDPVGEIEAMSEDNGDMVHGLCVIVPDGDSIHEIDTMSNDNSTGEGISFGKKVMRDVGNALDRLELDLARTSDKLVNLNLFGMQVAERENDFETFVSEKEVFGDSTSKALEFDILAEIFDSEVRTIDKFIGSAQSQIDYAREVVSSHNDLEEVSSVVEKKLFDAEESIKQSREQVVDLMMQSAKLKRILPRSDVNKTYEDISIIEDGNGSPNTSEKLKMQTSAQQQNILRMLEKSLARELDLDQKLTECTQALDEMKFRLSSSEQDYLSLEEETASVFARFLEADNASAILMGIAKELTGQLQSCQLNINCALKRESDLNTRLQNCIESVQRLEKEEVSVHEKNNLKVIALKEKVNSLEEQLLASEMMLQENASNIEQIKELKEKIALAESRVEKAETECQLLAEANEGLSVSNERVELLEKQLAETNVQLEEAMVIVEASHEKQSMLNNTISDMDMLIGKLKVKVSEANARADHAEEKWIMLSESNEEINEELKFMRGKVECLEGLLQRGEEKKLTTAKEIDVRTSIITDLVMQLAMEREELHKKIYMLMDENKGLANKLESANSTVSKLMNCKGENEKEEVFSECPSASVDDGKRKTEDADITEAKSPRNEAQESSSQNSTPNLETVRAIDPSWHSMKYLLSSILIALLAVLALCFFQPEKCPL